MKKIYGWLVLQLIRPALMADRAEQAEKQPALTFVYEDPFTLMLQWCALSAAKARHGSQLLAQSNLPSKGYLATLLRGARYLQGKIFWLKQD